MSTPPGSGIDQQTPPFTTRQFTHEGLSIRIAQSEKKDAEHVILLSPMPESIYAFTPIWRSLAANYSLLAVDLPGFGHSESIPSVLAPEPMGRFVVSFAKSLGITQAHAIGPDIGTSALLSAAAEEPDFFSSIVIGSGGLAYPLQVEGLLKDFIAAERSEEFRDLDINELVKTLFASMPDYTPPQYVVDDYIESYPPQRFVDCLDYVRSYPRSLARIADLLPQITTPVQVIAGRHDPFVPIINAEFAHQRLPHSSLAVLDTGHMVWEEAHAEYGARCLEWLAGGYLSV
ncbi:alpha/beta fold hydrolase [Streptomyces sp. NPDC090080]|uniref:alpha/beta fold hydrolase n=1 Tax=Streptomyces sp. NPDC090080 TaxID=3365939 RepID=UPI0038144C24